MDSQDPNPPGQTRDQQRRANRKLLYALLMMTAGAFAFGWALVPLYGVLCKVAGIGNVQAKEGQVVVREAIDRGVPLEDVKKGNKITLQLKKLIVPQATGKAAKEAASGLNKFKLSWARS